MLGIENRTQMKMIIAGHKKSVQASVSSYFNRADLRGHHVLDVLGDLLHQLPAVAHLHFRRLEALQGSNRRVSFRPDINALAKISWP